MIKGEGWIIYLRKEIERSINDYKFFCFNGKVRCFKIDFDRFSDHGANYYDIDGNLLEFGEYVCPPNFEKKIDMPSKLKEMIVLAEKLSHDIDFLRVDFYEVQGKIYFGELTFFPASGFGHFVPNEWDNTLGQWLHLSKEGI